MVSLHADLYPLKSVLEAVSACTFGSRRLCLLFSNSDSSAFFVPVEYSAVFFFFLSKKVGLNSLSRIPSPCTRIEIKD